MSGLLALTKWIPGGPAVRLDTTCGGARRGRVYWPTIYNRDGVEIGTSSDNIYLEWRPSTQRTSEKSTHDRWIEGSDHGLYAPLPPDGSTQRPVPPPQIRQNIGPLWASTDGEIWIAGGNPGDPAVYVALASRAVRDSEPLIRTTQTVWGTAGDPLARPRWAWAISAPTAAAITFDYLNSTDNRYTSRSVTLPGSAVPWSVNGAIQVTPSEDGPFTWELAR